VTDSFRTWPINNGITAGQAIAVGRYIEDVYYNGNPWYLNTLAAAEQLYYAIEVWKAQGSLAVTSTSLSFFRDFDSSVSAGTYASSTTTYQNLVAKIAAYADGYVANVQKYLPSSGHMAEQYDKSSGTPLSARDLTWSYASFLTAVAARRGSRSSLFGWSAGGAPSVPGACRATSVPGAYASATATSFPATVVPGGGNETVTSVPPAPTPTSCLVSVTFNERVTTAWGDSVKMVGSVAALGSWSPGSGVALSADQYTASNPLWRVTVSLTAGQSFEYKFVKVSSSGSVTWESDPNRSYTPPSTCGGSVTVDSSWR
jgi:glucoamylase